MQEDQFSILPLPIWNHVTEYGDVEEIDNIQPAAGKETDIIKPAVVEIVDSGLMVYSRRLRLMQEQDPISLANSQSSTPKLGTSNPSNPSLLNHNFDTDLDIRRAICKGVRSCTKHPLSNFLSYHRLCHQYKAFTTHLSSDSVLKNVQEALGDPRWKMKALYKNETWDIVDLPKKKNNNGMQVDVHY